MQIRGLHKSKQFFFHGVKYLVSLLALASIIYQLQELQNQNTGLTENLFTQNSSMTVLILLTLIGLTSLNWAIEGFKWKLSVGAVETISLEESIKQCLVGASVSILTPAKLGDYAAKPMFYEKQKRLALIWLNTLNHLAQMSATCVFGITSLVVLFQKFPEIKNWFKFDIVFAIAIVIISVFILLKPVLKKRMNQLYTKLIAIASIASKQLIIKVVILSFLRFFIFSAQYIILLYIFGSELSWLWSFTIVSAIYFLNSILPTPAMSDGIVKGSLGIFLFGLFGVNAWFVLGVSILMWLSNHVMPAIIGSVILMKTKALRLN